MLDKNKIKEKLEKERDMLVKELQGMGKFNTETGEWEATPEATDFPESDQNLTADRFEKFESESVMLNTLQQRWSNITKAIKNINRDSFGKCEVCKKDIEAARMQANPAARTCKKHLEN